MNRLIYGLSIGVLCFSVLACSNKSTDGSSSTIISKAECQNSESATSLIDCRDNQEYSIVTIGTQTWFAENLNFATDTGSWCYADSAAYCERYGRLYTLSTAMNDSTMASVDSIAVRGACPWGWHLPTNAEWVLLAEYVTQTLHLTDVAGVNTWHKVGKILKATDGWNNYNGGSGSGTDDFGFKAVPGGKRFNDGSFYEVGNHGNWWSASLGDGTSIWNMEYVDIEDLNHIYVYSYNAYSVRCVKD